MRILWLLWALISFVLCFEDAGALPLARVGSEIITLEDLDRVWEQLPPRLRLQKTKRQLLDALVDKYLLAAEAERRGLDRAESVVSGLDRTRRRKLREVLFQREVVDSVTIAEEEIRRYYAEQELDRTREVRARHIMVKTRKQAEEISDALRSGADFAELAGTSSQDTLTAGKGGDLGYWREDKMRGEFAEQVLSMHVGEISEPFRSKRGYYHIIEIVDVRPIGFEKQRAAMADALRSKKIEQKRSAYIRWLMDTTHLRVEEETLDLLLQRGKVAVARIPSLSFEESARVLLRYDGGEIALSTYIGWLEEVRVARRPVPADRSQIMDFAKRNAVTEDLFPMMAERLQLDRTEEVRAYLHRKRKEGMVEALRRTIEREVIPEDSIRVYYEGHRANYAEPDRVFVEATLAETLEEAQGILEEIRQGMDMCEVAGQHPLFSGEWSSYNTFPFSPSDPKPGTRIAGLIEAVKDAEIGELRGPVRVFFEKDDGGRVVYAVVRVLHRQPARLRSLDEPEVKEDVLRHLISMKRGEIGRAFDALLSDLRRQYADRIILYEENVARIGGTKAGDHE